MLMNYHEMTMAEPSDSPQRKKQFAFTCAVMAAALSYMVMTSGVMLPLEVTEGIFPGGNFCYKFAHRDYAASMGLGRRLMSDLTGTKHPNGAQQKEVEDILYHVFLDNPYDMGGRRLRWATGILVADSGRKKVDQLLALNKPEGEKASSAHKRYPTDDEFIDLSASEILDMLPYELTDFPSVDALVAQFPNSYGFVSALVMSYKLIPGMKQLAKARGAKDAIVIATCSKAEEMCTLYAPLVSTSDFLMGQMDPETYRGGVPNEALFSYSSLKQGVRRLMPFAKEFLDKLP